ncbi:DUF2484 family protein [Yoonia litorea]|uniref:DUF2484 family protein n=1 Tax=Yoonia litorea TaxID=1123755 RepID=A0A1I6MFL1_9RHOB|nr:DUF2484 family protein [Yoonia litorea]SFS14443.1 Protein of unknown function [Yoonia litorea]
MADPWVLIGLWVLLSFVMAVLPSKDNHWRRAYVLIIVGLPLLVWLFWRHGVFFGSIGLIVGCLILRWPVYYFWLWVKRRLGT